MLSKSELKSKIMAFIADSFIKDSGIQIEEGTSFLEKGIIDSTGVMELVSFLEETFEITMDDEEIIPDNFDSLEKLVTFVENKLAKKVHSSNPPR
jgi:acyl carrier protein